MGYSHSQVIDAFLQGRRRWAESCNMITDGETIYSYGAHFPIAMHLGKGVYLFNTDYYSVSTSVHQNKVRWRLRDKEVWECTTEEIQAAEPGKPVVLTKVIKHDSMETALRNAADCCKKKGMTLVPYEKWRKLISHDFWLNNIRDSMRSDVAAKRAGAVSVIRNRLENHFPLALKLLRKLARDEDRGVRKSASNQIVGCCWRLNTRQIPHFEKMMPGAMQDFDAEYLGSLHVRSDAKNYSVVLLSMPDGPYVFFGASNTAYVPWAGGKTLRTVEMAESVVRIIEDPSIGLGGNTTGMRIINNIKPGCAQALPALVVFNDL